MQNNRTFNDWYTVPSDMVTFPFRIKPYDGYYPLLSIPALYKGPNNPYFQNVHNLRIDCRLTKLNIRYVGSPFIYRKGRSWSGPKLQLFAGLYSALGSSNEFDYMPSSLLDKTIKFRMRGDIDIFCLAVTKVSELPEFGVSKKQRYYGYRKGKLMNIEVDLSKVTILVNEEKLRKTLFTKTRYTASVRRRILDQLDYEKAHSSITIKDVSDEYLTKFTESPNAIRTNSFVESHTLEQDIKSSVFSNLNRELA